MSETHDNKQTGQEYQYEVEFEDWTRILCMSDYILSKAGEKSKNHGLSRVNAVWELDFGVDSLHCLLIRRVTPDRKNLDYTLWTRSIFDSDSKAFTYYSTLDPGKIVCQETIAEELDKDSGVLFEDTVNNTACDPDSFGFGHTDLAEMRLVHLLASFDPQTDRI